MTRTTAGERIDLGLEDDRPYRASLRKPKEGWLQESNGKYGKRMQLVVEWDLGRGDGIPLRDWIGLTLNPTAAGIRSKLHRLLNALAEKPADTEVWWDPDTLEWGYDLADGTPAYAKLTEGMTIILKGENGKNDKGQALFRVTGYRPAAKAKGATTPPVPVDVDPDEVPDNF